MDTKEILGKRCFLRCLLFLSGTSLWVRVSASTSKRPEKSGAVEVKKGGYVLLTLAFLDLLAGVANLRGLQFSLAPEFDAPRLCGLHPSASAFGD